jgi:hypothetical protein
MHKTKKCITTITAALQYTCSCERKHQIYRIHEKDREANFFAHNFSKSHDLGDKAQDSNYEV